MSHKLSFRDFGNFPCLPKISLVLFLFSTLSRITWVQYYSCTSVSSFKVHHAVKIHKETKKEDNLVNLTNTQSQSAGMPPCGSVKPEKYRSVFSSAAVKDAAGRLRAQLRRRA